MPTYTEKIPISDDPVKLMDLGMKVYARHCVMGSESPLLALQANSWEENKHVVNNALRLHELIEEGLSTDYSCKQNELIDKLKHVFRLVMICSSNYIATILPIFDFGDSRWMSKSQRANSQQR